MKIFKPLFLISAIAIAFGFNLKEDTVKIWTDQTTVDKAIEFEKSLYNKIEFLEKNVFLSESIYPLIDQYELANPIIVQREQTGFLPVYAEYFYSKSDSIIRYISYDWEKEKYGNFFKKQKMWKEENQRLKEYNSEYKRVKSTLIAQLGEPSSQDSEPQKTESTSGRGDYLSRNTVWETDEYYSELNMIFESMTYRIRWYYYWKK